MNKEELLSRLEGLLFIVGDEGIRLENISEYMQIELNYAKELIDDLSNKYQDDKSSGLCILYIAYKYKIATKAIHNQFFQDIAIGLNTFSLSNAALETLAIVAYRGPITKSGIEAVRGVNSEAIVRRLVTKALLKEAGKEESHGRPTLYTITDEFLDYFKLSSLEELPSIDNEDEFEEEAEEEQTNLFNMKYQD